MGTNPDPAQMTEMDHLMSMYGPEDLHPELAFYVVEAEGLEGWQMLHHPLVIMIPYTEEMNKMANAAYASKLKALSHALDRRDFNSWVFLHERPYRVSAMLDLRDNYNVDMSPREWLELAADVWADSENIWQSQEAWRDVFDGYEDQGHLFMNAEDHAVWVDLRHEHHNGLVRVWRGWGPDGDPNGWSWSLSSKQASWFATRFGGSFTNVRFVDIDPALIWAYSNRRNEEECIIFDLPEDLLV